MHVLYVTICSPWCITFGGGIRNAGLLRGLARRHRVEVALLTDELTSPPPHPPLGTERIHVFPVRNPYVARAWISHPANRLAVRRRWLDLVRRSRPDAVWYFGKSALRVVGFPPATPVVVDLDNVDWWRMVRAAARERGTKRLQTRLRAALTRAEDRWLSRRADITVLANADEIPLVRQTEALRAIPNGADFATPPSGEPRTTKRLLHLGSLRYPPNLDGLRWFCRAVWPRVLAAVPDTWLDIVGWSEPYVSELRQTPRATVAGHVDDLGGPYAISAGLVVPLRIGTGTRTKVLEAWANGLPVVSTTVGVEGLAARDGDTVLIGDTAEALAVACVQLLRTPALRARLAARAFTHGQQHFGWEAIYPRLDDVLDLAIERASR